MKNLRKILYPFSLVYDGITSVRNFLYDIGVKKSTSFDIPIIAVGNLSVGGTGKTPMVEYLIRLLSSEYRLATLSRGYKRKSKGFYLANDTTTMEEIGDEPYQYYTKFAQLTVAVDANRVEGVNKLLQSDPNLDVIVLDDAFQHRKIKAGFYIVLSAYDELFYDDLLLPAGNLRESSRGLTRADLVVITKCPENICEEEQNRILSHIDKSPHEVYFSSITYDKYVTNTCQKIAVSELKNDFIAVAGIAKPQLFYKFLSCDTQNCLTFPDHHYFSPKDIFRILEKANGKKIITTEKDYMRLQHLLPKEQLYFLPIQMQFVVNQYSFDKIVTEYVGKSSRKRGIYKKTSDQDA